MSVRGIRGATTASANSNESITAATTELLAELVRLNQLQIQEICFAYFTTTPDLDAEFPAYAARKLGWVSVPLLCGNDMVVPGPNPRSVPMCIRILLLYNTEKAQSEMRSAYLRGAQVIRADLDKTAGEIDKQ